MTAAALVRTIGCKLNQSETAEAASWLEEAGYRLLPRDADVGADLIFINTCYVTARAAAKSRQAVSRLARLNPGARIIVAGCLAQGDRFSVENTPGVSEVWGTRSNWPDKIESSGLRGVVDTAPHPYFPAPGSRSRPLLKIQDGCDQYCAFCVIPFLRGRLRSLPKTVILNQTRALAAAGAQEIAVTGVRIGSWGFDTGEGSLAGLLREMLAEGGRFRIRLGSVEPWEVTDDLLTLIGSHPRVCPHLHISLQHTDPFIIERMGRPPLDGTLARLVEFSKAYPFAAVGTDLIAGFPGETGEQFERHLACLEALPLSYIHTFPFSARPGTLAANLRPRVNQQEAERRAALLREVGHRSRRRFALAQVGREVSVIPDAPRPGMRWVKAISENYIRLRIPASEYRTGLQRLSITPNCLIL